MGSVIDALLLLPPYCCGSAIGLIPRLVWMVFAGITMMTMLELIDWGRHDW